MRGGDAVRGVGRRDDGALRDGVRQGRVTLDLPNLLEPASGLINSIPDRRPMVLNQLYQYSTLQTSFSLIFLALVDGKPRVLSLKQLLEEFLYVRGRGLCGDFEVCGEHG